MKNFEMIEPNTFYKNADNKIVAVGNLYPQYKYQYGFVFSKIKDEKYECSQLGEYDMTGTALNEKTASLVEKIEDPKIGYYPNVKV